MQNLKNPTEKEIRFMVASGGGQREGGPGKKIQTSS